jgi:hypothetical protein
MPYDNPEERYCSRMYIKRMAGEMLAARILS